MKRIFFYFILLCSTSLYATQTTYTFYNAQWAAKIGTYAVSGSDGWVCDIAGAGYAEGRYTPQGYMYAGVQVTNKDDFKNAGATSVLSFTEVRRIVFNYCTNNSKGQGTIYVKVGNSEEQSLSIERPEKDKGSICRDIELVFPTPQTGKISFRTNCTENSIYINSITIKAKDGSPNITGLTADAFELVTNTDQLRDSDEIIFGVSGTQHNYIMGLYDEWNSRNNIYALKGVYSPNRQTVNENPDAVYTLRIGQSDEGDYYTFADIDGYFLVASGGNPNHSTNNYLTIWDTIYSRNYGYYGAWKMNINEDGSAEIENLGVSRSNKIQFNINGNTPIFACYADWTQTKPALYRRVVIEDPTEPYIKVPICNFGTVLLDDTQAQGQTTIEVNAVNLTEDMTAQLAVGKVFSLDRSTLDRDGDKLTISYSVDATGVYHDTLIITSGTTQVKASVLLSVQRRLTVREACALPDLTQCYLQPVVITKKYDKYIFVRDETGSMLLFDSGNLYGKDCANGDILTGVTGLYKNYYGNPDINLTAAFSKRKGDEARPELFDHAPDSADVCKYVRFENVGYSDEGQLLIDGKKLTIYDMFKVVDSSRSKIAGSTSQIAGSSSEGAGFNIEGIVYYYNRVVFCPTKIEYPSEPSDLGSQLSAELSIVEGVVLNPSGETISLYTLDGKCLSTTNTNLQLSNLPEGLYILRTPLGCQMIKR